MKSETPLFLIDGHALCYRSFYAIKSLTASNGQPTNAVYGFISTVKKILEEHHPENVVVCFDSKEKTKRQEKYAEYKIQRPTMPDDLISQIPIIKEVLGMWGVPFCEVAGYEADDLMATLTKLALDHKMQTVIVTDDKDMYQLAGKDVTFLSSRENVLMKLEQVKEKLGFDPQYIPDFLALAGDSSDNIPGVKGIGKVTAQKLINRFGKLEDLLRDIDDVSEVKVKEKLIQDKEMAVLSKELALLEYSVPLSWDIDRLKMKEPHREKLFEAFKKLEFRRLAEEFSPQSTTSPKTGSVTPVTVLDTEKAIERLMADITKEKQCSLMFSLDKESTTDDLYVKGKGEDVYQIPTKFINQLGPILQNNQILKITYDLKFFLKKLKLYGIVNLISEFDCLLAGYVLGKPQARLSLVDLAWDYLNVHIPPEDITVSGIKSLDQLHGVFIKALEEQKLKELLYSVEQPLAKVLFEMEEAGVALDCNLLKKLSKDCTAQIEGVSAKLYKMAGEEFNLNSPKQLCHILFEKLKLPVIKKTKTGFSTDEEVLTILAKNHELPALILEYRQLAKLKSTYIDALPEMLDAKTNRIHAQFDQTGAETGRLSSRQPNLQNIPIRTELGRQIRKAIVATDKNHILIAADYSQIELRVLAHLSQDEGLIKAFVNEEDIHRSTAVQIFEVDPEKVDYHMRDMAKRVNFGIVYGMSAFGLAKDLKISNNEAQDFIDRYFLRFPKVKIFIDETIRQCEKQGYVTTLLNRRRYIPEIKNKNMAIRQYAQRQAMNTPVQGSAADLIKLSMIDISHRLKKEKLQSKLIMSVHDELVFDAAEKEVESLKVIVKQVMESALSLTVPIKVTVKTGHNWLEITET